MTQKEKEQYSITNAVCDLMEGKTENSFEREVSRELDKKLGASRHKNSIRVPLDMQMYNPHVRAMSQGTNSAGGYLVQTDLLSESMIDVLRNKMVVSQLGATVLTGLVDSIAIPRVTAATSGSWIAENSAASEGSVTLDQVTLSPKTASVHTVLSRKLRQMVRNPSIDAFVFNEIAKTANVTIDAAAFNGTGASNQPTGIRNQSGINTVDSGTNGGAPSWEFIVDMESEVANDNAYFGASWQNEKNCKRLFC
jgi:HK97 family phage major capsid protein